LLYYILPGHGIYGGVKKGFHCAAILTAAGHPCVVATPNGERPSWFETSGEVITRRAVAERCRPDDTVLFSCPADAACVDALPARRKIVHMQGANTAADHALFQLARGYEFISHGLHMTYELQRHGRVAPYVPLGIPDVFRWNGEPKVPRRIVVMPRKGAAVLQAVRACLPEGWELVGIDGMTEREVAREMKQAEVFVAISQGEAFGLPPLEAMCAACCVVGFSGDGGFEFMRHGETAHVVPNGDVGALIDAVGEVCRAPAYRAGLRRRGHELSRYYSMAREREYLLRALGFEAR
jgi:hypothetical protein